MGLHSSIVFAAYLGTADASDSESTQVLKIQFGPFPRFPFSRRLSAGAEFSHSSFLAHPPLEIMGAQLSVLPKALG